MPDDASADAGEGDEEGQSGLGRGLAAIIPTLAGELASNPATARRRRRRGGVAALLGAAAEPADEVDSKPAPDEPTADDPAPAEGPAATDVVAPPLPLGDPTPVDAPDPVRAPSAVRELRDDLVGALLDGLARTMALDVCGYLHHPPGERPHLFLLSPPLDGIGPARAYELFDALRADLESGASTPMLEVAGFRGLTVTTAGVGSRGVWVVARAGGGITDAEREVATRFCRSFGRAVHQLDGAAAPAMTIATPVHVRAHRARDSVLAEVQVRIGHQIRPGQARADTGVEAVTRAVIEAADRPVGFRYASEVAHEGEHAAVVLLEGGDHAVALGSALTREGGGVATALAAIRALDGLAG